MGTGDIPGGQTGFATDKEAVGALSVPAMCSLWTRVPVSSAVRWVVVGSEGLKLRPRGVRSAFLLLGFSLPPLGSCLGFGFVAKNPTGFSLQHPKPQARTAPTRRGRPGLSWPPGPLASGLETGRRAFPFTEPPRAVAVGFAYLCPPLAKSLRQRLSWGCCSVFCY